MAVLDPVVLGLGPGRVARQPAGLAQLVEAVPAAGDDLVDVGLVAGVPQDDVVGRVEHPVQGQVSSTTPRFDPRWPPLVATACTMKSRISPASSSSSG